MSQPDPATVELAKLLGSTFVERRDAKAIQTVKGYEPVRVDRRDTSSDLIPWSLQDLVDHVQGTRSYGHYVVSPEGTCRIFVFDIDLRKKANVDRGEQPVMFDGAEIDPRDVWAGPMCPAKQDLAMQLRAMSMGLAQRTRKLLNVKTLVSYSGSKGVHVTAVLDPGTPAATAREAAGAVIDSLDGLIVPERGNNFFKHAEKYTALGIEVFPKQDEIRDDGFGNLVRLPLGVNRKSNRPGFFIDMGVDIKTTRKDDAIKALQEGSLR